MANEESEPTSDTPPATRPKSGRDYETPLLILEVTAHLQAIEEQLAETIGQGNGFQGEMRKAIAEIKNVVGGIGTQALTNHEAIKALGTTLDALKTTVDAHAGELASIRRDVAAIHTMLGQIMRELAKNARTDSHHDIVLEAQGRELFWLRAKLAGKFVGHSGLIAVIIYILTEVGKALRP